MAANICDRPFKTMVTMCSTLEQRSVIKCLVAKKCRPYEIYGKYMCTEKYVFHRKKRKEKNKWTKHYFATKTL